MKSVIRYLKSRLLFKVAVIYLRYIIGFAFVFASLVKIKGDRFTSIPPTEPVGYFFEAMYRTGYYWNFLGWTQFLAGSLLMTQRFATVGALLFLPIIVNVFMITHAIDFGIGTPLITTGMLLGTVFLVLWDYEKWRILFQCDHTIMLDLTRAPNDSFMNDPVWTLAGAAFIGMAALLWVSNFRQVLICAVIMIAIGIGALAVALRRANIISDYRRRG